MISLLKSHWYSVKQRYFSVVFALCLLFLMNLTYDCCYLWHHFSFAKNFYIVYIFFSVSFVYFTISCMLFFSSIFLLILSVLLIFLFLLLLFLPIDHKTLFLIGKFFNLFTPLIRVSYLLVFIFCTFSVFFPSAFLLVASFFCSYRIQFLSYSFPFAFTLLSNFLFYFDWQWFF